MDEIEKAFVEAPTQRFFNDLLMFIIPTKDHITDRWNLKMLKLGRWVVAITAFAPVCENSVAVLTVQYV